MYIQKNKNGMDLYSVSHESKIRGSPMFPCGAYWSDMTDPSMKEIQWHWHKEIEVLVVVFGVVHLNVNGELLSLQKGEGAFINSSVLHAASVADEVGCKLISLVFSDSLLSGSVESVYEQRYIRPVLNCHSLPFVQLCSDTEWSGEMALCIRDAYKAYNEEAFGFELVVREKLSHMWYLLVTNNRHILEQQYVSENTGITRVKAMMELLHQKYAERINLQQLAAAVNISERECLRCFKSTIGVSPMQYLQKYRISVSARYLSETSMTITEIGMQTGFESPSHFARSFKHFMQCTPTDYRRRAILATR